MVWFQERAAMARKILNRPLVKAAVAAWAVITAYDTLLSQFFPEDWAKKAPKMRELVSATSGWLPWWAWLLVLAAIIVFASFEYAVRNARSSHSVRPASEHDKLPTFEPDTDSRQFTQSVYPIHGETWSCLLRVADQARRVTEGTELAFAAQDYGTGSRADVLAFYAGKLSEQAELHGVMPPSLRSERITQRWPDNISFHVNGGQMDSTDPRSGKELYRFIHMYTADVGPALAKIQKLSASNK
jgi:hypothetical protein